MVRLLGTTPAAERTALLATMRQTFPQFDIKTLPAGTAGGSPAMEPPRSACLRTAFTWDDGASANQSWDFEYNWDVGSAVRRRSAF